MDPEILLELIKRRRTIRCDFLPRRISKRDLKFILESARWAPSGHNIQPWEFIVVQKEEVKREIAKSTMRVIEELLDDPRKLKRTFGSYSKWFHQDKREALAKGYGLYGGEDTPYRASKITSYEMAEFRALGVKYCRRIETAPLILVTLLNRVRVPPNISSGLISLIGVGAAIQNVRLAALAKGIGCQDMARPIDTVDGKRRMKQILNVPPEYEIVSVMRLGYINPALENIYYSEFRIRFEKIVHHDSF